MFFLRVFLFVSAFLFIPFQLLAQDQEQKNSTVKKTKKTIFLIFPELGYAQETGFKAGIFGTYSFYLDTNITRTRNSNINFNSFYTAKNQFNLSNYTSLWTKENKAHITADISFINFPLNFYGLGNETAKISEQLLDIRRTRAIIEYEFLVKKNIYLGYYLSFQNDNYETKNQGIFNQLNPNGSAGGNLAFGGLSLLFDNRDYPTYAKKGAYHKIQVRYAPEVLFNDYDVFRFNLQSRKYKSISDEIVLAGMINYQFVGGNSVPFYLLNELGNENLMRAYYSGRFRDEQLIAAQTELRWWPLKRFIFAAFVGTGNVFGKNSPSDNLKPNYGAGFRYVFDIASRQSLRFDYGFGEKRNGEKRIQGLYISVNEAF